MQAPGRIAPRIAAKAVDFRGTCSWGRAPGSPDHYRVPLRIKPNPSGTILVRGTARFDVTDASNVIGELPTGATVFGDGPVYGGPSQGTGYAILVRGNAGRVCRGYVSLASVFADVSPR